LPITPEFSRLVALDGVSAGGASLTLKATLEECRALAARFGLVRLDQLEGEVKVERVGEGELIHVAGRLHAAVAQRCVVTLEPFDQAVDAEFDRLFSPDVPEEASGEVEIDAESELPEPLPGTGLDLGEILAEELSLALDPYPRSPEADQWLAERGIAGEDAARNPFAALASLRKH
jgi:uncharacterized metal-binding protein YceD (DUF177 family)